MYIVKTVGSDVNCVGTVPKVYSTSFEWEKDMDNNIIDAPVLCSRGERDGAAYTILLLLVHSLLGGTAKTTRRCCSGSTAAYGSSWAAWPWKTSRRRGRHGR